VHRQHCPQARGGVRSCLRHLVRKPDPADFEPIVQPGGITTFPDSEPYHYPFALIANVCEAIGAAVERMPSAGHPGGESLLVISRRT
jgi:hypothetical protein